MQHRFLLFLIAAGMTVSVMAQQPRMSIVVKDADGQKQVFLLENLPLLTFDKKNDVTTITVKDMLNNTMSGVLSCIFKEVEEPIVTATPSTVKDAKDSVKKYIRNGVLYIERNGVRYNVQGQRVSL